MQYAFGVSEHGNGQFCHFGEIFVIARTESCQNGNFWGANDENFVKMTTLCFSTSQY